MIRVLLVGGVMAATVGLNACGEKAQTVVTRKSDTQAWQVNASPFAAPGWKEGDRSSWEEQLRTRAQGQNDYAKVH